MENLNYIVNPVTGKHINIYSINGLEILNKFVNHYKGGAEPNTVNYDYNFGDLEAGNATCEDCKSKLFPENKSSFVRRILPFLIEHMKIKDNMHVGRGELIYDNLPKIEEGKIQDKQGPGPTKINYNKLPSVNIVNSDGWKSFIETTDKQHNKTNETRMNRPQIKFKNKSIKVGPKTLNYDIKTLEIPDEWFGYNSSKDEFQLSQGHSDYKTYLKDGNENKFYDVDNENEGYTGEKNCVVSKCDVGPCSFKKKRKFRSAKNTVNNIDDYHKYFCDTRRCLFVIKPQFKPGNTHHLDFNNKNFVGLCEDCGKKFLFNLSSADENNCWKSQLICGESNYYKTILKYLLDTPELGTKGETAYDCLKYLFEKEVKKTIKIEYVVATKVEKDSFDEDKIGTAVIADE